MLRRSNSESLFPWCAAAGGLHVLFGLATLDPPNDVVLKALDKVLQSADGHKLLISNQVRACVLFLLRVDRTVLCRCSRT
jgi:hypothetical protein